MKYEDFGEILEDDFSGAKFGENGHLQVIGWFGRNARGNKLYCVKCSECAKDPELFGDGLFKVTKGNLTSFSLPCGCAKKPHWKKEQYEILVERKCKTLGYTLLGFTEPWKGNKTKLILDCACHGQWKTTSINDLLSGNRACRLCYEQTISSRVRKPDSEMIASFFASGAFHPETKFWRSDRKTKEGNKVYWNVYCPDCETLGESVAGNLQRGFKCCECSSNRQKFSYINMVEDDGLVIAVKFGITNVPLRRAQEQNSRSIYKIYNYKTFEFPSKLLCAKAEQECMTTLHCGVVSKTYMLDGWSETTYLYNIDKIIEIYERNGAIEI